MVWPNYWTVWPPWSDLLTEQFDLHGLTSKLSRVRLRNCAVRRVKACLRPSPRATTLPLGQASRSNGDPEIQTQGQGQICAGKCVRCGYGLNSSKMVWKSPVWLKVIVKQHISVSSYSSKFRSSKTGGKPIPEVRAATYYFDNFFSKLHEAEHIIRPRRGHASLAPPLPLICQCMRTHIRTYPEVVSPPQYTWTLNTPISWGKNLTS